MFPKHIYPHTPTAVHNSGAGSVLHSLSVTNAREQLCRKKNPHHPGSESGEFKCSRMWLGLLSSSPKRLWHLADATFHTGTSTTKPVSPGVIIYSKSTRPGSRWLGLQSSGVPFFSFPSKDTTRTGSYSTVGTVVCIFHLRIIKVIASALKHYSNEVMVYSLESLYF